MNFIVDLFDDALGCTAFLKNIAFQIDGSDGVLIY